MSFETDLERTMNFRRCIMVMAVAAVSACTLILSGCTILRGDSDNAEADVAAVAPELLAAEKLYESGDYHEALVVCVDVNRQDENTPGLNDLRNRCISALLDQREARIEEREAQSVKNMELEAEEMGHVPPNYMIKRFALNACEPFAKQDSPLYELLANKVTIHLKGANVGELIETLSANDGVNMIADKDLAAGKAIDIEVDDVPLQEVLDFISRNYSVDFYLGENIIWVTTTGTQKSQPLVTRIYHLKKGLQLHGDDWGENKDKLISDLGLISGKATVLPSGKTYLEDVVERFVPKVEGAEFYVDRNIHAVFAKNTPDNLKLIGEILETLDRSPPQVLIEARFIEISQSDLRELGLEWALTSPFIASKKNVYENGAWNRSPKTQIGTGDLVSYSPYTSDASGAFPLGPLGSFGLVRGGNPPTASQGLNLTYQGVLTEPMFQAILHAIDISGAGKTLSVPRVTTVNNNPAKLRDGDDMLYYKEFEAQAFNLVDDNNKRYTVTALIPKGEPEMAELGITLVAVPSVGADNKTVSLLLMPSISVLDRFVSYQNESVSTNRATGQIPQVVVKLPVIRRREVQTKVIVESGETVVLGGLIRTVQQETLHKVPFLGSIPLIGHLFRRIDVTEENKNLLIFVTATVISERGESILPAQEGPPKVPSGRMPEKLPEGTVGS